MAKVDELPEAIAAIATEEAEWSMIHFGSTHAPKVTEVGRNGDDGGYYRRVIPGTNDLSAVEDLPDVPQEPISPSSAQRIRNTEAAWRRRPEIARLALGLWSLGFLEVWEDGVIDGELQLPNPVHPNFGYYARINPDGAIEVEIKDSGYIAGSDVTAWHGYALPRTVPVVHHTIALAKQPDRGPKEFTKTIYGSDTVTTQVVKTLEAIQKAFIKKAA